MFISPGACAHAVCVLAQHTHSNMLRSCVWETRAAAFMSKSTPPPPAFFHPPVCLRQTAGTGTREETLINGRPLTVSSSNPSRVHVIQSEWQVIKNEREVPEEHDESVR